ncbi:MAG: glutamate synthase [Rickettsiales bacterium]|nr:glutamate synthase [Rickettsiales bacterium]RPG15507.1 MAG: glutamate synthase subunit beta [Pelagibacteraceae bacterium TMED195]|tara:strand:+ start:4782 stop:6230 length:1449 start_codon:yes stop_codon:yes gene_type:complete
MGKVTGFLEHDRAENKLVSPKTRVKNFKEFIIPYSSKVLNQQASRCMNCGIPYCHSSCPVNNIIPEWNELVYDEDWENALKTLHSTNNFPEFTGRICPAPCEASCTLNIEDNPVAIKSIERSIIDKGYEMGWVVPEINKNKTDKKIAVVGSGPAGLASAQQLARAGHTVTVFEKNDRAGGLLRYGIPNFKMEKHYIDKRIVQMQEEGVEFKCDSHIGENIDAKEILNEFDAIVLACGSEEPRDLNIPGRQLDGIHFAMDFLTLQNKMCEGDKIQDKEKISAKDKHVVVIGGGDTGSDCIGTSNRQGAKSVTQLEILDKPPEKENKLLTWPNWPLKLRTSSSHEEGVSRNWSVSTKLFEGYKNKVSSLRLKKVKWERNKNGQLELKDLSGSHSEIDIKTDLVLLAMGFLHPKKDKLIEKLGLDLDDRGNVKANDFDYKTNQKKIFVSGDMRRGQSLVVWAIREGRQVAHSVDQFLMGKSNLPY